MRSEKHNKIAKYLVFAAIGIAVGAGIVGYPKFKGYIDRIMIEKENDEVITSILNTGIIERTNENVKKTQENEEEDEKTIILENAYLDVPFICQAPFETEENWKYHEESCEEAALLQVHYYLKKNNDVDVKQAHETILDMISWQENNFGRHMNLYANDMKTFITNYYDYTDEEVQIIYNADISDIKKSVSAGYPVIVPIMGNVLKNPYYPEPGYHMLTVTGYTPEHLITNDVGTRRGEDFSYKYDVFMKALEAAGGNILVIKKLPS
jgi:hypothetical protein